MSKNIKEPKVINELMIGMDVGIGIDTDALKIQDITLFPQMAPYSYDLYTLFSYKNVEAEICRKFKNVLRMFQDSYLSQHQKFFVYLHR